MSVRLFEPARESRLRAGRRRSNSSPESLRHPNRVGETPLESDGGTDKIAMVAPSADGESRVYGTR